MSSPPPTPAPPAGYKPGVAMPFIAPPPQGTSPEGYYNNIMETTTLTVVPSGNRLSMTISSTTIPTIGDLFAVTGGLVTYIPAGASLPLPGTPPPPSPGAGSLVLETWIGDLYELKKILPGGVPPEFYALYLNVTDTSVRAALTPMVQALTQKMLKAAWNQPSPPGNRADLEKNYLDRVLLGQVTVFVKPGDKIGEAAPATAIPSDHECTLVFKNNAGNELSPVLHLRGMPSYADEKWEHHPIAVALESVVVPVNINLQFEVWNTTTKAFEKLPAGIAVDVVDYDPLSPNDLLDTQHTDSLGRVQFNFSSLDPVSGDQPDIFFLVHTNGASHAGHTLPEEWSTKGWKAVDGSPGYYEDFAGTQLGESGQPLVFRIGVDFHLKLEYLNVASGIKDPAPKGVPISLRNIQSGGPALLTEHTDGKGEVHGVLFNIEAEDDLHFHVEFELEDDNSIHLKRTRVLMDQPGWSTFWDDADRTPTSYYPDLDQTSIGTQTTPAKLTCTVNERNVALYLLKIVREWNTFFFLVTDGAWTGIEDLLIFRDVIPPATLSFSWPVKNVHIHPNAHWNRETIVHELSHQVVWQQADYSTLGIAVEARLLGNWSFFGELSLYHSDNLFLNNEQAFIEGWPEFIAGIFSGSSTPYSPKTKTSTLRTETNTIVPGGLGPPPNNRGESVEGAFANGLWSVFQEHVVKDPFAINAEVVESINGDITREPWLMNPAVRSRFLSMIWQPLNALAPLDNPTTTAYIARIQAGNTADWPAIQATLRNFNMAF
jgi:hypothetical protein